ncbi:hypothetical protein RI367_008516 [Sorochytrium milnesiophthora]
MATIAKKQVGATGLGLLGFTWRPQHTSDELAFAAMRKALSMGANLWSTAEFYGSPDPTLNLQLLQRYFTKYPEDADKVVLVVKGGLGPDLSVRGSAADITASVERCLQLLKGSKRIDVFSPARVDPNVPIEETVQALKECVHAGKIDAVGLSECSAATIERAYKIHPIALVEVEFSLWSTEILENGVADVCKRLGITIMAYSPLGRGFLTGKIKSVDDIPEGDFRRTYDRFQPENLDKNLDLVHAIDKIAAAKGVSSAQLALAWVKWHSGRGNSPIIIPIPGATREQRVQENCTPVTLTDNEEKQIAAILQSFEVKGGRYNAHLESTLWG